MTPLTVNKLICPPLSIANPERKDWQYCWGIQCQFWQDRKYWTNEQESPSHVVISGCGLAFPVPALNSNGFIPV